MRNQIGEWIGQFHCGHAVDVLQRMPRASIDTVVTSPPYFRQRDYTSDQQIGIETTPQQYLQNMLSVTGELFEIVGAGGSLWIVIGDKYIDGQLLGMPWQLALAMKDQGWILRSDVIWHKPNAMPSSVKSRPTTDHEYVFFFSKSKDYYYDADAIREPHVTFSEHSKMKGGRRHFGKRGATPEAGKNGGNNNLHDARWDQAFHPNGRNKRTVWSIPLSKFRGAHFAVFPETLVENCIRATCPPNGIVLDPFSGSGTTAVVATKLDRQFVAIDCVEQYCQMARQRLASLSEKSQSRQQRKESSVSAETPHARQTSFLMEE
jgi:DNA modification methylase